MQHTCQCQYSDVTPIRQRALTLRRLCAVKPQAMHPELPQTPPATRGPDVLHLRHEVFSNLTPSPPLSSPTAMTPAAGRLASPDFPETCPGLWPCHPKQQASHRCTYARLGSWTATPQTSYLALWRNGKNTIPSQAIPDSGIH